MSHTGKHSTTLAFALSLVVHGGLLAALLWWASVFLLAPEPAAKPVPMRLSMLQPAEPVVEAQPLVEPVSAPPPEPTPAPIPAPTIKPKPPEPKPEPKAKPEPKPKDKPEVQHSKPVSAPPAPPVLEAVALAEAPAEPRVAPILPAPVVENTAGLADAESSYKTRVRQAVDARKHYPQLARRMGEEGRVVVEFSVDALGGVSNVRVKQSSGNARLDAAALQAVRDAAPFPPFPEEVQRTQWTFSLPLSFSLDS